MNHPKVIDSKCIRKKDNLVNFYVLVLILFYFTSMAMSGRVIHSLSSLRLVNWFPMDDGEPRNGTQGLGTMPSVQLPPPPFMALGL